MDRRYRARTLPISESTASCFTIARRLRSKEAGGLPFPFTVTGKNRRCWLPLPLQIVLAKVQAVLAGFDALFALRSDRKPVLRRCIPVQIAILNDLADFENPRVIRRSWLGRVCRVHTSL